MRYERIRVQTDASQTPRMPQETTATRRFFPSAEAYLPSGIRALRRLGEG